MDVREGWGESVRDICADDDELDAKMILIIFIQLHLFHKKMYSEL